MKSFVGRAVRFLGRFIFSLFAIIGIITALCLAVNYAAYKSLSPPQAPTDTLALLHGPGSPASLELYRHIFKLAPGEDPMGRFKASPSFARHPTLQFITQPIDNRFFRVGREGIRYQPGWDDAFIGNLLAGTRPLIFAFGGSTTLGHGIANDETWPYFLNRVIEQKSAAAGPQQTPVVMNFGAQAYDQHTEIDKLIYLLKAGYRPSKVIFLDGWNDLFMARTNMRLVDQVIYHGFSVSRGEIAFTRGGSYHQPRNLDLFLDSLPLYQYLQQSKRQLPQIDKIKVDRNAFDDGFDFQEAEYLFRHWAEFGERHREHFKKRILDYYRNNLKLLKTLSAGYGFKLEVLFQPIGLLDETNSFVPARSRTGLGYRYVAELAATVKSAIAAGELDMVDISGALDAMDEPRYIDVAHYSPAANQELARVIASILDR